MEPGWRAWESYASEVLGCRPTIASGNKWFDPGDAVTRGRGDDFPLYVEAKYTGHASFRVKLKEVRQSHYRAIELGKRFVMAIRIWPGASADDIVGPGDYALVPLEDLAELLQVVHRDEE